MTLEFFGRIQKELSLTGSAVYESVIAIAERVNRKVHILRLHGQSSSLLSQIESTHGTLGRNLSSAFHNKVLESPSSSTLTQTLDSMLTQATDKVRRLKQDLLDVDAHIRELRMETVHEDLLALQRDLSLRSAGIERFTVPTGAPAVGKRIAELGLPASVRVVSVFRGPFLIPPSDELQFRPDDTIILMGLRTDLELLTSFFTPIRSKKSA